MPVARSILIAEEDPTLLDVTAFRLELLGYRVKAVETAAEALEWLLENTPDLAIVGQAADSDPIELLNRLSDEERLNGTPVIFLSANSEVEEVQRAFNAGADEYLLIPYDPLLLERKIEGLLSAAAAAKAQ